jgi:hypothetical protein
MERKYGSAFKSERDKYDFKRFFLSTFIYTDIVEEDIKLLSEDTNVDKDKFIPPVNQNDDISVRKLKLALLNNNSPLVKIRNLIPISYNYLIVERIGELYDISIFPTSFTLHVKSDLASNKFS